MQEMMRNRKKKSDVVAVEEEKDSEDWCFECKDGGDLIICDYKGCLKVYHPRCVGKKKNFMNSGRHWTCQKVCTGCVKEAQFSCLRIFCCSINAQIKHCSKEGRHSCSVCTSTSRLYCLCCPNASLCRDCFSSSEFALLRGNNGLCKSCLNLILLAEENSEYGSEGRGKRLRKEGYWLVCNPYILPLYKQGYEYYYFYGFTATRVFDLFINKEKIDFEDRDTFECLFKECWEIIKEKEGFTLDNVYTANTELKKGENHNCRFDSVNTGDSDESKDSSDSELSVIEFQKTMGKRKRFQPLEFTAWGSKPLIQFLRSIGKDTAEKLSQFDVESIIFDYIKDRDLYHPKQKKMVRCDEKLYSIFKKKSINRVKIYSLLEEHFAKKLMVREDSGGCVDEKETKLEDKNKDTMLECKKRRVTSDENKGPSIHKSCFASIIAKNMKLVYIRRSLLEELLKEPDHSERKILGSFVRVKNDPQEYLQRNTHQLSQVKGLKKISATNGADIEILLQVSYFTRDVPISLLSDTDFTQDECEDLRQHMANGLLKKPTVVELQEKARVLHEDITKHWIQKELVRLQNRVDYTNEKGLRRELFEYLEQRELLKQASEQERLLKQLPEVIPEVIELESGSLDSSVMDKQ